jgi:hypothetical protein
MWGPIQIHRLVSSLPAMGGNWSSLVRVWLRWCAVHTGVPVILVAAVSLVVSLRLARRWARFAVEVALALGVLIVASRFGWVRW